MSKIKLKATVFAVVLAALFLSVAAVFAGFTVSAAQIEVESFKIIYEGLQQGQYNPNPDTYTQGSKFRFQDPEELEGYTFLGWFDAEEDGNKITFMTKSMYGDLTLYARYEKAGTTAFKITGISVGSVTSFLTSVLVFLKKRRRKPRKTVKPPEAAPVEETLEMIEEFQIDEADEE